MCEDAVVTAEILRRYFEDLMERAAGLRAEPPLTDEQMEEIARSRLHLGHACWTTEPFAPAETGVTCELTADEVRHLLDDKGDSQP